MNSYIFSLFVNSIPNSSNSFFFISNKFYKLFLFDNKFGIIDFSYNSIKHLHILCKPFYSSG